MFYFFIYLFLPSGLKINTFAFIELAGYRWKNVSNLNLNILTLSYIVLGYMWNDAQKNTFSSGGVFWKTLSPFNIKGIKPIAATGL